mmetsp:Transcript_149085/g.275189  ORF Transcript_149085/g.275189 Transcript_149085/m.275189 type:complete len:210 (-) Transcript_149085:76-705(-)
MLTTDPKKALHGLLVHEQTSRSDVLQDLRVHLVARAPGVILHAIWRCVVHLMPFLKDLNSCLPCSCRVCPVDVVIGALPLILLIALCEAGTQRLPGAVLCRLLGIAKVLDDFGHRVNQLRLLRRHRWHLHLLHLPASLRFSQQRLPRLREVGACDDALPQADPLQQHHREVHGGSIDGSRMRISRPRLDPLGQHAVKVVYADQLIPEQA